MKATALDADPSVFDPRERRFVEQIREHGWTGLDIFADGAKPNFYFSTGMWRTVGCPEIIIVGLRGDAAHDVIWDIFRNVKAGKPPAIGVRVPVLLVDRDVVFQPVDRKYYPDHLGWARWFYAGDDFPCLQIIWPDRANRFPWEEGYEEEFLALQTDLTSGNWGRRD
ncbi:MAG TPA: DUF4262 domain-containing protein [Rhizomicrobium sp.]|nr:DUF4262 domain-containing protein [Rhizomicrobium sp.]